MANIQTRTIADNRVMYTARIRIKGYRQQTATLSRLTDAKQWVQETEARIREGMHFSQFETSRHSLHKRWQLRSTFGHCQKNRHEQIQFPRSTSA